jgi:hypothetical protein
MMETLFPPKNGSLKRSARPPPEGLSTDQRLVQVQAPAMQIPSDAQFFSTIDPTKPDIAFLKNHFYREGRLSEEHCLYIIEKGTELLKKEPNLLEVDAPITGQCHLRRRIECLSLTLW